MDQLDLDIHNYTISDIETFFQLKPKSKYTAADIEFHEYRIREQLLNSGHIDKRYKRDLIVFLETAKEWLMTVSKSSPTKPPTTIPKNYKLDRLDTPVSKEPPSREEEIIQRINPEKDMNFFKKKDTNQGDFYPGVLNPMNTRTRTQCLTIDTRFRDAYSTTQSSDFMIQMPAKFQKVVSMELASFEIPFSFYNICSAYGNNFFSLSVSFLDSDLQQTTIQKIVIVEDGNYEAPQLIAALNALFAADPSSILVSLQWSLGTYNGKVTLSTENNQIQSFSMDFTQDVHGQFDKQTQLSSKLGWVLGFIQPVYSNARKYTSESVLETMTIRYFFLAIDDFHNNSTNPYVSVFQNSLLNQNILARISVRGRPFGLIREDDYSCVLEPRRYFGPVDIQRVRVRLLDEQGRLLAMNHVNYSFCLKLNMLYDL